MRHITRLLLGSTAVYWDNEGAGGGQGGGQQGGGQQQQGGSWSAPQGMPAEFVGADANETLGKLWAGYGQLNTRAEGLRGELARVPKAPDSADKYSFTPSEKLAPYFPDLANNVALNHARAAFHKAGVPDAAFAQIIEGVYGPMIEEGILAPPYDAKKELASYQKHAGVDAATAGAHVTEATNFAKGLAKQLQLPADLVNDAAGGLEALTDTAGGVALLRALQSRLASSGFVVNSESQGGQQGEMSDEEWNRLSRDPRIDPRNEGHRDPNTRYDAGLRARWDAKSVAVGRARGGTRA